MSLSVCDLSCDKISLSRLRDHRPKFTHRDVEANGGMLKYLYYSLNGVVEDASLPLETSESMSSDCEIVTECEKDGTNINYHGNVISTSEFTDTEPLRNFVSRFYEPCTTSLVNSAPVWDIVDDNPDESNSSFKDHTPQTLLEIESDEDVQVLYEKILPLGDELSKSLYYHSDKNNSNQSLDGSLISESIYADDEILLLNPSPSAFKKECEYQSAETADQYCYESMEENVFVHTDFTPGNHRLWVSSETRNECSSNSLVLESADKNESLFSQVELAKDEYFCENKLCSNPTRNSFDALAKISHDAYEEISKEYVSDRSSPVENVATNTTKSPDVKSGDQSTATGDSLSIYDKECDDHDLELSSKSNATVDASHNSVEDSTQGMSLKLGSTDSFDQTESRYATSPSTSQSTPIKANERFSNSQKTIPKYVSEALQNFVLSRNKVDKTSNKVPLRNSHGNLNGIKLNRDNIAVQDRTNAEFAHNELDDEENHSDVISPENPLIGLISSTPSAENVVVELPLVQEDSFSDMSDADTTYITVNELSVDETINVPNDELERTINIKDNEMNLESDDELTAENGAFLLSSGNLQVIDSVDEREESNEPVKAYMLPFESDNPQENIDNEDPEWSYLKKLETDKERYQFSRERWKSMVVPDPNINVTTFSYKWRQKNQRAGHSKGTPEGENVKASRKRKLGSSEQTEGRPPNKRACRLNLDFSYKAINKSICSVTDEFQRTYRYNQLQMRRKYEEKIHMLQLAKSEVTAIHQFYMGLPDQDLSVSQNNLEQEHKDNCMLFEKFKHIYHWNGRLFVP